jgi:hypothetical protein
MFKKNHRHLQIPLTSHVDDLPEKLRKRLACPGGLGQGELLGRHILSGVLLSPG